ncbi:hypothetical protein [Snodgrassella sp. W8158]|uniref:hypothetical protein n=1 Tax=Snodgrassella sp. W8158 TaxID=2751018 RepID=UPI0018DD49DA|nr:hypothetical protein [Snodgrassella sp. W8158]
MKQQQFVRLLHSLKVIIKDGTKHLKLYHNGKQATLPRHPGKEISNRLIDIIKKQLGIEKSPETNGRQENEKSPETNGRQENEKSPETNGRQEVKESLK